MENGFAQALAAFRLAARSVPAYKKILQQHRIKPGLIKTRDDFEQLPVLDKKNFIHAFPPSDLVANHSFPGVAYASSGSSGKPTFWFRNETQEKSAADAHEIIFREIYRINKQDSTLVIICFSMGIWVAGNSEFAAFRDLTNRGYNVTTITPGIEKKDILSTLKNVAPYYKYVVLAGYPPFISDVLHTCKEQKIPTGRNIRILTAGDTFPESWRDAVMELLHTDNPEHILNVYGCADASLLGFETPLSIFIRRQTCKNPRLFTDLFGQETTEPTFVQYNPKNIYFEQHNKELIFTAAAGIPLIRYNIHDVGETISHNHLKRTLVRHGLAQAAEKHGLNAWQWPFVVRKGRTDVAVNFYALNIYPEHFRAGVEDKRILKTLSGNFFSYNKDSKNHKAHSLHVTLELAPHKLATKTLKEKTTKVITEHLLEQNIEYRKLHSTIGKKAFPVIHLEKFGNLKNKASGLIYQKGTKPKMIV